MLGHQHARVVAGAAVVEVAKLFPSAIVAIIAGGGHFPWLDTSASLVATLAP